MKRYSRRTAHFGVGALALLSMFLAQTTAARSDSATSFGTRQNIRRGPVLPNEGFEVEFASLSNRLYCVQYSSDLKTWKTAQSVITGNGSWTQWVDTGPPETESHPATQTMRFYRLFLLPGSFNNGEAHDSDPGDSDSDDHHDADDQDGDHHHDADDQDEGDHD